MNFCEWLYYFKKNQTHFDHLSWDNDRPLTLEERECITTSIQEFQRGEYSEGKHFIEFTREMNDESYTQTIKAFIKEEQDHAITLGKFMDSQSIPRIRHSWLDGMFRKLRRLAGLEGTITVLLTAEIMAVPYYQALAKATGSRLLRQICRQILTDEAMHLRFQSYTLGVLYKRKSFPSMIFSRILHHILMAGTIVLVWFSHTRVLRAGGYRFGTFFNESWDQFRQCKVMIRNWSDQRAFFQIPQLQVLS